MLHNDLKKIILKETILNPGKSINFNCDVWGKNRSVAWFSKWGESS